MVRHIYRDLEAADAAALQGNSDLRRIQPLPTPEPSPRGPEPPLALVSPALEEENHPLVSCEWNLPPEKGTRSPLF